MLIIAHRKPLKPKPKMPHKYEKRKEKENESVGRSVGTLCTTIVDSPFFIAGSKFQLLGVIVKPSTPCPLPGAALRAPDVGVEAIMLNPSSDALLLDIEGFEVPRPRAFIVIDSPSAAWALLGAALTAADTGVVDRVGA